MTPDKIFRICNTVAIIPWLLMMLAPSWTFTQTILDSFVFPLALAAIYSYYIFTTFGQSKGNFFTLVGVGKLFQNPKVLLAAWVHYLVFDMLIGLWEFQKAKEIGINHLILVVCLFFTLMFGPFGFLLFMALKYILY